MAKTKAAAKHAMPPLDRPVEAYWAEYKQQPSEDIRNILIEHYLPQVKSVAQRIHAESQRAGQPMIALACRTRSTSTT